MQFNLALDVLKSAPYFLPSFVQSLIPSLVPTFMASSTSSLLSSLATAVLQSVLSLDYIYFSTNLVLPEPNCSIFSLKFISDCFFIKVINTFSVQIGNWNNLVPVDPNWNQNINYLPVHAAAVLSSLLPSNNCTKYFEFWNNQSPHTHGVNSKWLAKHPTHELTRDEIVL